MQYASKQKSPLYLPLPLRAWVQLKLYTYSVAKCMHNAGWLAGLYI